MRELDNSIRLSNRDRFFEKIKPIFESSRYDIRKATEGKYRDKIIQIVNKDSGVHDFHIWCHVRNDRLDLLIPDIRIRQIPSELGLMTKNQDIKKDQRLDGQDATSFQGMDEEALIDICKFVASKVI